VFLIYGFLIELKVLIGVLSGLFERVFYIFLSEVLLRTVDVDGLPLDKLALCDFLNLFNSLSI
jgi:hypothetical protein